LSLCIPVVTLPKKISVLHFALGQIKDLNSSFLSNLMIAKNVKNYIEKILDIVNEKYIKLNELKRMICRKKKNLFSFKNLEYVSNEWRVFLNSIV
jgi:uncharacterized HAD superfamily protein